MTNRVEKLSLLSEMISKAKNNRELTQVEHDFLLAIAKRLDISREDFDYLVQNPVNYIQFNSHSEQILQFHKLVLLMNVDTQTDSKEMVKLFNYGLRMGLNHETISRVLYLMDSFPNKIIPAGVLIDIFKVQYN